MKEHTNGLKNAVRRLPNLWEFSPPTRVPFSQVFAFHIGIYYKLNRYLILQSQCNEQLKCSDVLGPRGGVSQSYWPLCHRVCRAYDSILVDIFLQYTSGVRERYFAKVILLFSGVILTLQLYLSVSDLQGRFHFYEATKADSGSETTRITPTPPSLTDKEAWSH